MFCPKCGAALKDGASFCTNCGASMGNGNAQTNFNQPYQNNQAPRMPIRRREIALCIILSIITCGIYGIYWYVCLVDDLNLASGMVNETSGVTVFLLTLVTCGIYGIYWYYKAGEKLNMLKARNGMPTDNNMGIIFLVLSIFGLQIVNECIIQNELNKVASI